MPAAFPDATSPHKPSPFFSGTALIAYLALARFILYLFAGPNYGYFRDELYYLACGEHPAWGYVDQPPLFCWIAWLLRHTIGTSLWAMRSVSMLAGVGTIILTGLLARELGGRRWAIFLASLSALLAPILLGFSHLFTMNALDPALWTAIAFVVVRLSQTGNQRLWLVIGALAGITILNKYAILFWLVGLLIGVLLTPLRNSLRQRWFWLAMLITTLIALPNLLWQWRHQFPFLQIMHNVRESGRDVVLPPLQYLKAEAEMLGYVAALLVVFALVFFFSKQGRASRALGWAFLIFLTEMIVLRGKMYYVTPVFPMMLAAGAVGMERATRGKAWIWAKPALALGIITVSGIYAPMILPLLSVPHFLAYEHKLGIQQQKIEHNNSGVLPQIYADMFGWQGIAQRVAAFYNSLPPEERARTAIFANNYGDAGAIDFFGPRYGLPKAIGGHQNYWIWGPRQYTGESMIVLGEGRERNMQTKCASYRIIGNTNDPLSMQDGWLPIYYCQGFKWNLQEYWPEIKRWN